MWTERAVEIVTGAVTIGPMRHNAASRGRVWAEFLWMTEAQNLITTRTVAHLLSSKTLQCHVVPHADPEQVSKWASEGVRPPWLPLMTSHCRNATFLHLKPRSLAPAVATAASDEVQQKGASPPLQWCWDRLMSLMRFSAVKLLMVQ